MNPILTFTTNGVAHTDIEEAHLGRLAQIREDAYRAGVEDALRGAVRPAPAPRPRRRRR